MAEEPNKGNQNPPVIQSNPNPFNAATINVNMVYANGSSLNMTQSDMQIIFIANGRPVIMTALSLPVAKHLKQTLDKALSEYERKTDSIIPDILEITEKLKNK